MARGEHSVAFPSPGVLRHPVEIDAANADLDLGLADAALMALAKGEGLPILTLDFEDFRAPKP
jgi:hypothetical protein